MFWSQIILSLKFYCFQALGELISQNMMCYGVEKPKIAEKAVGSSFLLFLLCHQGTCIGHLSYFLSQIVVSVLLLLK